MNLPNVATNLFTRRAGLLALLVAPLAGCSGTGALNALVPSSSYRGKQGVAYGSDARHFLDIYQPLDLTRNAPLVVFFYGGSWTQGERANYRFVGEALAARGIVTVIADYRLSPGVRYPGFLDDCALAVKWAFDHASQWGADASRIHVMGHSAGAYNAAMLALDARLLRRHGLSPQRLAGWIGLAGPYDFLPIDNPQARVAFDWPTTKPDTQPINHVSTAAPRALLLAAQDDDVVNPQRSTVGLAQRLQAAGVPVRYQLFGRVSHVTLVGALAGPLQWLAPVLDEVVDFVQAAPARS